MVNTTICAHGELLINEARLVTTNSDLTDFDDIKKPLKDVVPDGIENINYLQAIKRVTGRTNKPLAN